MKIKKGLILVIGLATTLSVVSAQAEWAPQKPIQITVGFAPGGGTDQTARLIASAAQEFFPVPLTVVNRPGASGTLAAELVANAEPDGYTMLVAGGSESTSVPNHMETGYSLDDFRGVLRVNREHMVIVSKAGNGLDSIEAVVEYAKENPGELVYASSGPAGVLHSAFLVFEREAGISMKHVPYQGGSPSLSALLGNHVDLAIITPGDAASQVEAGNVIALATTSDKAEQLPNVPSLTELGYNVNLENMKGLVVPAETPDEVVEYLETRFTQAMESDTFKTLAERGNITPGYLSGEAFQQSMSEMSASIGNALSNDESTSSNEQAN
ncbi:Bug family tripartite tricarboxylate transporter substrate binding protein [Vreelandella sp. EE22]